MTAIVLALAIGAVACTISLAKIFAPLRAWVAGRRGGTWRWLSNLIGCPYCVSHWLAFGATAIYRPQLVTLWLPLDLAVTAMAIVALAMVAVLVIRRGLAPVNVPAAESSTRLLAERLLSGPLPERDHVNGSAS